MRRKNQFELRQHRGKVRPVLLGVAVITLLFCVLSLFQSKTDEASASTSSEASKLRRDETVNSVTGNSVFSGFESPKICHGKIKFPRDAIEGEAAIPGVLVCEGFFATSSNSSVQEGLPFPVTHRFPFCGSMEWARRLHIVEKAGLHDENFDRSASGIRVERQRGLSTSRVTGKFLGNKEFTDYFHLRQSFVASHPATDGATAEVSYHLSSTSSKGAAELEYERRVKALSPANVICWTGDLRESYVLEHNVVPSREFYEYVLQKFDEVEGAM